MVGRLDPIKDHQTLFRAMESVQKLYPQVRLLVIGDGPEREHLEGKAGRNILFLGNRDDVPDILRALDIFVLPSLFEGLPITVLEAMAVGKPVIASHVSGIPEEVEDGKTGILVPPADPAALGRAIELLAGDREKREQMGIEGKKRAEKYFTLERMVLETEELYERAFSAGC